jgi:hypothetical protein
MRSPIKKQRRCSQRASAKQSREQSYMCLPGSVHAIRIPIRVVESSSRSMASAPRLVHAPMRCLTSRATVVGAHASSAQSEPLRSAGRSGLHTTTAGASPNHAGQSPTSRMVQCNLVSTTTHSFSHPSLIRSFYRKYNFKQESSSRVRGYILAKKQSPANGEFH